MTAKRWGNALPQSADDKAAENSDSLETRRRDATKEEITELVEQGDLAAALKKALELI